MQCICVQMSRNALGTKWNLVILDFHHVDFRIRFSICRSSFGIQFTCIRCTCGWLLSIVFVRRLLLLLLVYSTQVFVTRYINTKIRKFSRTPPEWIVCCDNQVFFLLHFPILFFSVVSVVDATKSVKLHLHLRFLCACRIYSRHCVCAWTNSNNCHKICFVAARIFSMYANKITWTEIVFVSVEHKKILEESDFVYLFLAFVCVWRWRWNNSWYKWERTLEEMNLIRRQRDGNWFGDRGLSSDPRHVTQRRPWLMMSGH